MTGEKLHLGAGGHQSKCDQHYEIATPFGLAKTRRPREARRHIIIARSVAAFVEIATPFGLAKTCRPREARRPSSSRGA
ncbi:MAG: hypothetical protein U5K38_05025 [Woeseiaceae bacterium]|nr:hypothetical protein [Woeseiaceae bacterium]